MSTSDKPRAPVSTSLTVLGADDTDGEDGGVYVYAHADYENPPERHTICVTLASMDAVEQFESALRSAASQAWADFDPRRRMRQVHMAPSPRCCEHPRALMEPLGLVLPCADPDCPGGFQGKSDRIYLLHAGLRGPEIELTRIAGPDGWEWTVRSHRV